MHTPTHRSGVSVMTGCVPQPTFSSSLQKSSKKPPRGTTFYLVSDSALRTSKPVNAIFQRLNRNPRYQRGYVGFPWWLGDSRQSAQAVYTASVDRCSVARVGAPRGKGRLFHLMPTGFDPGVGGGEEALNQMLATMKAHRHDSSRPWSAILLGGKRAKSTSVELMHKLKALFESHGLPVSMLWGLPDRKQMTVLSVPKKGNGNVYIGISDVHPLSVEPFPTPVRKNQSLDELDATQQAVSDAQVTPRNWRTLFSDIVLNPGDRVFVGKQKVWPELPRPE